MKPAKRIIHMEPYIPIEPVDILAARMGTPVEKIIKLDANENPYGASPLVSQVLSQLDYVHIYPDPESRTLRKSLSEVFLAPFENLVVGSGADELIDLLLRVLIEPGDSIINCPPTFGMYSFDAVLIGAKTIQIARRADFSLNLEEIQKSIDQYKPKVIFICSPNNPDGRTITDEEIQFLLSLPALIVLDEAYIEFTQKDLDLGAHRSLIRLVKTRQNLVVLRTFSKWAGLAGLRVGFGAFPDWLTESIWKAKQPYNVNIAASAAALVSLKDLEYLAVNIARIQKERERLLDSLKKFPSLTPYPSESNFILCKTSRISASELKEQLASRGIFIRHYDNALLKDYVRISVGRKEDTDTLIQHLEELL